MGSIWRVLSSKLLDDTFLCSSIPLDCIPKFAELSGPDFSCEFILNLFPENDMNSSLAMGKQVAMFSWCVWGIDCISL